MIFQKLLTNGEMMLIATIVFCTIVATNTENDTAVQYHLQDSIPLIPLHYDAKIRFNYKTNDIIGECNIIIHINRQMENISMHPVTFAIFKIALYKDDLSEKIYIPRYSFIHKRNMLTIDFTNTPKLPKFLSPGRYTLLMVYMRHINNDKKHFSASSYSNGNPDNILIATGVDIMTAGQLFPCWDERTFNATYKISIKHHKNYTALSNMAIQAIENDTKHDKMWTHFEISPPIFIQHIRVIITSFTNIHTSVAKITFWGRKNIIRYLHLAECIAQQVLYFLKSENSIDKLPKIDYVAFWDSQHNTTETWGLILHREADVIYDEDVDSVGYKMKVSYFITSQIVSLWYSDVLLWSKTGFIKLLATYILYQIPSDYNIMNFFTVETQWESFVFDTPSNANKKNSLSYLVDHIKSSNIWRMLYHLITPDMFWTSIRTYVNNKQYNQTDDLRNMTQILLHAYPDDSNILFIIKEFVSLWIVENYYYPMLYVTRNQFNNKTRFQYLTADFIDENRLHLPTFVTYTTKSVMNFQENFPNKSFWLSPQKSEQRTENFDENDWIIVNLQQTGYYRVNYDAENWLKLANYMNPTKYVKIHVLNRAQIIDDAFYSFIHKELDYIMFWKISEFLSRDMSFVAWYPMLKAFEYVTLIVSIKDANDVKEKMQNILSGVLQEIGYSSKAKESDLTDFLRKEAAKWACIIGEKNCREVANKLMLKDLHNVTFVTQSEWKRWMYCNGLVSANNIIWYEVWEKGIAKPDDKFLEYLTCCEDPDIISNYLRLIWQHKFLSQRNNTRARIFLLTVAKHAKDNIVCDFVLQNLKKNTLTFTSNRQADIIATLIVIITHQHAVEQLNKVLEFAKINLREKRLVDAVKKKIRNEETSTQEKSET